MDLNDTLQGKLMNKELYLMIRTEIDEQCIRADYTLGRHVFPLWIITKFNLPLELKQFLRDLYTSFLDMRMLGLLSKLPQLRRIIVYKKRPNPTEELPNLLNSVFLQKQ
jgi:hypothetical protein